MQEEQTFAHVSYIGGDTNIGLRRLSVTLGVHTTGLVVRRRSGDRLLQTIPWMNIRALKSVMADKSYTAKFVVDVLSVFSGGIAAKVEYALELSYWDEPVQREQRPVFGVGADARRYETIETLILENRDRYMGYLWDSSRLQRRLKNE